MALGCGTVFALTAYDQNPRRPARDSAMADEYLQDEYHASAVGVDDLVLLPKVGNEAIVQNLKQRAAKGLIYTCGGSMGVCFV